MTENKVVKRFLRNFFASAEGSKTYEALGKQTDYICYVLKPITQPQTALDP